MGGDRVFVIFLASAILLFLHQASGQTVVPDKLKPELVNPAWSRISLAYGLLSGSQGLPFVQVRTGFLFGVASYDALAVYSDRLDGLVVRGSLRRPPQERTAANKGAAIAYATYRILTASYGVKAKLQFDAAFADLGLDPNDTSTDPATAVGMGNIVGQAMIDAFLNDEYNQLGNRTVKYNPRPAADWTGYKPKNTAYELKYPTRWQPSEEVINDEYTVVQTYFSVQLARRPLITGYHPSYFKVPDPTASLDIKCAAYKAQADRILALSASLNDTTKMLAEGYDGGFYDIGNTYLANKYNWGFEKQIVWNFIVAMCSQESQIVVIFWKTYFDTVRPSSVIRMSGLYDMVTAWGGPGKGTVRMKASEWRQYNTRTDPSPEYPSGACAFYATYAAVASRFLGTEEFGWSPVATPGASRVEAGTPKKAVQFYFPKFKSIRDDAILGREVGGVHFRFGAEQGAKLGDKVGAKLYERLTKLLRRNKF